MQVENPAQKVKGKPIGNYVNQIFPLQDFDDHYRIKKIVGKGAYGYVAKAIRKADDSFVAIKKITKLFESLPQTRRILREIFLLKNCKHPNIVRILQVRIPKKQSLDNFDQIYLITEFCDSDLQKVFKSDNIFFELPDVKHILYQLLCGLKYLHSANIIHRDLKPANVLINGQGLVVKICDFGLARVIEELAPIHDEESDHDIDIEQNNNQSKQNSVSSTTIISSNVSSSSSKNSQVKQQINTNTEIKQTSTSAVKNQSGQAKVQAIGSEGKMEAEGESKKEQEPRKKKKGPPPRMMTKAPAAKQEIKLAAKEQLKSGSYGKSAGGEQMIQEGGISGISKMKRKQYLHNPMAKLTLRVTTRWYRAPEVILLEKGYSKPIDIWSVGCIFGELIKMQQSVCVSSLHRFPLFPGKYCFPVSPNTLQTIYKNGYPQGRNDQLAMILSTLGKPTLEQMSFLTDENARKYLSSIECRPKKGFGDMFPMMPQQVIEILNGSMEFDPRKRATVEQILSHPFFQVCRNKQVESTRPPLEMEFQVNEESLTLQNLKLFFKRELVDFIRT